MFVLFVKVLEKEVEDILKECIKPNFVEIPDIIQCLPSPDMRGNFQLTESEYEGSEYDYSTEKDASDVDGASDLEEIESMPPDTRRNTLLVSEEGLGDDFDRNPMIITHGPTGEELSGKEEEEKEKLLKKIRSKSVSMQLQSFHF